MIPPFDIFYVSHNGYIWQEPAESLIGQTSRPATRRLPPR